MKKILFIIIFSLFVLSAANLDAQNLKLNFDKITVVSDDNYPPFSFRDNDGNLQGILPDQWKLWEKKTGIKVVLIGMDWDMALKTIKQGKADVIDTIFFTDARAEFFDFTKPYAKIEVPIFFHKSISGINKIESVRGFRIAVKRGDACIQVFLKHGIKKELVRYNSYEDIVKAAAEQKIRMFCIDAPPALYFLNKYNIAKDYRHSKSLYTGEFHRAVRKGRTGLLNVIENGFSKISDKEYAAVHEKWYGETIPFKPGYVKYIGIILAAGTVILVIFFLLNLFLRKQVKNRTLDLVKANQLLRVSEEKYRAIFENANEGIVIAHEGRIAFSNPAIENFLGYPSGFLKFKPITDFIHPDDKKMVLDRHEKRMAGENVETGYEFRLVNAEGEDRWIKIYSSLLQWEGKPSTLNFITDITEQRLAEKALRTSEEKLARSKKMESLGLLAGGVAHDLNNVLSGIVSYPELLLMDLPEDSRLKKPLETIHESGKRAAAIVQDLLTVARGVATTKEPLNLNDIICDYLKSPEFKKLKSFCPAVAVNTSLESDLLNISGSGIHIRKVVMNLVSNASEAIDGCGDITISTANRYLDIPLRGYNDIETGEYVVLTVSDEGKGISQDDLERIFEPFYTKKVMGRSGTGLGLAVVWNVLQDHNGYVNVTSDKKGTTFELYFPVTREKISNQDLIIPVKDYKGNGEMVLVVDDIESQRDIACRMLFTLGYKAKAVSSGEEAVEYMRKHTVDLILLDMIMDPGINGCETYEKIIDIHPEQKAVIASGFAETDDVKKAQKLGAGKYIKKPYNLEKLGMAVKNELKH